MTVRGDATKSVTNKYKKKPLGKLVKKKTKKKGK